jgi:NAD(P)-dependent dehydrogenase (short-subunit alcohol dehydrogenase family)
MRLDGKTALVAGGTAGIGLAVARAYVEASADVVIGGRRAEGAEIAREAGCAFVTLDVAEESSWAAALEQPVFAEMGGLLDVVVLNAGVAQPPGGIADLSSKAAGKVVATNLIGTFWGLQQCPPRMADGGSIVITSSISAVTGTSFEALYGATKAGVTSLARSGAIDLGPRGIRVNAVRRGRRGPT